MVKDVLFDLDDTLCDFKGARRRGSDLAFAALPEPCRSEAAQLWRRIEPDLFRSFAAGEITREEYRWLRFYMILAQLGQTAPSLIETQGLVRRMNDAFMREVNDHAQPTAGAAECLATLRDRGLRCHVLTNGPADSQRRRIRMLGFGTFFAHVFVGEEIGAFKPDLLAFTTAVRRIGRAPDQVVMIGDDLAGDVLPAREAGLHAVHYSPAGSGYTPLITHLDQLWDVVAQL